VRSSKYWIAAALATAATQANAAPVAASKNSGSHALILVPLTLTKIADLDFGTIVPSATSGSVTINAKTSVRTTTGGAFGLPSDLGHRGYFGGAGSPNQQVIVSFDQPDNLVSTTNPADLIPVLALTLDGSPIRTIDPVTRTFFFGLGGVIQINSGQADGDYVATFDVTANYL
jgi:hypothetical protein